MKFSAILITLVIGVATAGPVVKRARGGDGADLPDINSGVIQPPPRNQNVPQPIAGLLPPDGDDLPDINSGVIQPPARNQNVPRPIAGLLPPDDGDDLPDINSGVIQPPPRNQNRPQPLPLNGGSSDPNAIFFPQN
ncbi:hypothetical protein V2A60_000268 [Cordyceps javanica]